MPPLWYRHTPHPRFYNTSVMSTLLIALGSLVLYLLAYHTYGRWLARRFFKLDPQAPVPSRQLSDGQDFVPTHRAVLFGHHFTSIAGTGPIVGPALAVIWGWLPALLWVLLGSIFMGAVHDLGALVVSMRNRGQTIGEVAGRLINPRVKILFLIVLFLALMIVLAIFGLVIANVFAMYPASVLSTWVAMPVAVLVGFLIYKKGVSPHLPALIAMLIMVAAVVLAAEFEFLQFKPPIFAVAGYTISPIISWSLALFVYCYFASVLPVWVLLQPRDYVNSYQLLLGLLLIVAGIGAATFFSEGGAPHVAPAIRTEVPDAPPIMPFLFVTIACGAISGFHCLVSSGTSSKQIAREPDAQFVAYGSMLTEGFLAVLVILACCAGLGLGIHKGIPVGLSATNVAGDFQTGFVWEATGLTFEQDDGRRITIAKTSPHQLMPSLNEVESFQYEGGPPSFGWTTLGELHPGQQIRIKNGSITLESPTSVRLAGGVVWDKHYGSWAQSGGLAKTVSAFVDGAGNFVAALGIPRPVAIALMAVLVASFAATTLDTATRLQRYVIQELAGTFNIRPLTTRHGATIFAVLTAAVIAAIPPPGKTWAADMGTGGLTLWPVFGATNQLLAGLAFMVVAFYLARRQMPTWFIVFPAVLMLVVPFWAMSYELFRPAGGGRATQGGWLAERQWHLIITGVVILALQIWMVAEALKLWPRVRGVLETQLPPLPRGFPVIEVAPATASGDVPGDDLGRSC